MATGLDEDDRRLNREQTGSRAESLGLPSPGQSAQVRLKPESGSLAEESRLIQTGGRRCIAYEAAQQAEQNTRTALLCA